MLKSNLHTHTVFCDGNNTPEEMVIKAIELGFSSLGFSAHSPMFFENDYAVLPEKFSEYYNEIERLKKLYSDKIEIYNGVELDKDTVDLSDYKFDYIIASVHQIHKNGNMYYIDYSSEMLKECVKKEFDGDFYKMISHYYNEFTEFVINVRPDMVGHFDLIEKYNSNNDLFDRDSDEYKNIVKKALTIISEKRPGQIFEINTGAMYRMKNNLIYPSGYIMKLLKELGFNLVINSDSHSVNSINFGFEEAIKYCREFGFECVSILKNGKFKQISI